MRAKTGCGTIVHCTERILEETHSRSQVQKLSHGAMFVKLLRAPRRFCCLLWPAVSQQTHLSASLRAAGASARTLTAHPFRLSDDLRKSDYDCSHDHLSPYGQSLVLETSWSKPAYWWWTSRDDVALRVIRLKKSIPCDQECACRGHQGCHTQAMVV